jgi:hypothetical protein
MIDPIRDSMSLVAPRVTVKEACAGKECAGIAAFLTCAFVGFFALKGHPAPTAGADLSIASDETVFENMMLDTAREFYAAADKYAGDTVPGRSQRHAVRLMPQFNRLVQVTEGYMREYGSNASVAYTDWMQCIHVHYLQQLATLDGLALGVPDQHYR